MKMLRSVTVGAVATAMLATSTAPAMAQGYPGGYGGYGRPTYGQGYNNNRYRHRGNDNTGAIVAGVIGVGILAAILSSASKSNRNTGNAAYGSIRSDNDAADACASEAERQSGGNARTRSIDTVDQVSGGFNVRGTVSTSYSGNGDSDARGFNCTVRQGNVQRIDFGGYADGY
ncbi:MAG: hypothetical protein ABI898_11540 [Sphingomonadales bacterium]